jgi:hypothetical protein
MSRLVRARWGLTMLGCALLSGCAGDRAARYAGDVSGCGPASHGVMSVENGQVLFTPDEGTWVLRGTSAADGAIVAVAPADAGGRVRREGRFVGRLADGRVRGELAMSGCTAQVDLALVPGGLSRALPSDSPLEKLF